MSELALEILRLRGEGLTYNQIVEKLGCSKSTVSYYLGKDQKIKNKARAIKWRNSNKLSDRIMKWHDNGSRKKLEEAEPRQNTTLDNKRKRDKIIDFRKQNPYGFSIAEAREKIEKNPVCYLTGKYINLDDPSSYELDHIIPRSKGGDSSLDNLGLTTKAANRAKSDLTLDEFLALCYDVLVYHDVIQPDTA